MIWPKRVTVEAFRDQIYQPRLALILLICLLGSALSEGLAANKSSRIDASDRSHPPPGSFITVPSITLQSYVTRETMPPLVQLHALWLVRFALMVVEDHLDMIPLHKRTKPSPVLKASLIGFSLILFSLATAASGLTFRGQLERICPPLDKSGQTPLLPLRGIVAVEWLLATISLITPWSKLDPFLSSHVRLPSPSHSPSIAEALRIPEPIAALVTGQVVLAPTPGAGARGGRRQALRPRRGILRPVGQMPIQGPPEGAVREPTDANTASEDDGNAAQPATVPMPMPVPPRLPPQPPSSSLRNPLRLQSASQQDPKRPGKAPRKKGVWVAVETPWLMDTCIAILNRLSTAIQYVLVIISLPSLSPTSLPPLVALLALRWELSECANIWTSARSSVECLEFVVRRWTGEFATKKASDDEAPQTCAICFETVYRADAKIDKQSMDANERHFQRKGSCRLDCGHDLHPSCLCTWLMKQAFCPVCHLALSAMPSTMTNQM